jgi:hypothetical protein
MPHTHASNKQIHATEANSQCIPIKTAGISTSKQEHQSTFSTSTLDNNGLPPTGGGRGLSRGEGGGGNKAKPKNAHRNISLTESQQSLGTESNMSSLSTMSKASKGRGDDSWSDDDILDSLLSDNQTTHKPAASSLMKDNTQKGRGGEVDVEVKVSDGELQAGGSATEMSELGDPSISGDYVPSFLQTGLRTGRRPRRTGVGSSGITKPAAAKGVSLVIYMCVYECVFVCVYVSMCL